MRSKAAKLFAKIIVRRHGPSWCINKILQAFEDVAVDFAWEMLVGYGCKSDVTIDQLKAGFRDYALPLPFRPNYDKMDSYYRYGMRERIAQYYPHYKTQAEIARERAKDWKTQSMRDYEDLKYRYTARPGIDLYDGDPDRGLPVGYISPEDADYLWGCMPKWIKDGPGDKDMKPFPMWYGTLTYEGDLEVHNEVKRILNRP